MKENRNDNKQPNWKSNERFEALMFSICCQDWTKLFPAINMLT